eukprot:gnl/TRDRNA2_/TRDRNA2_60162_c0_seq1.p1 gnl/TRDRNA2_/TRDRNA2_60162_c0~~gnl/TRDRNA2_/TRDRNA2_60162_c0_seq1.p1  ORF type:complete len:375 (-),score=59.65 gnl/TRDRNA2_/TRDRNA2_60162_c0_seq1:83-1207(-)
MHGGSEDGNAANLNLKVVTPGGELHGTFDVPCGEKVNQFIERLGLDKENMSAGCIVLLHDDRLLQPNHAFRDYDIQSGATLTLLRERQSRLRLAAWAVAGESGGAEFSWVEETSQASELSACVADWCRKFVPHCCVGSYGAVCTLENPAQMQRLVDSGELSKAAAVEAILTFFIRSLLAVGRLGYDYGSPHRVAESSDNAAATAILREYLPLASCNVNVLGFKEAHTPEKFANLSEPYLKHVRENDTDHFASFEARVKDGLKDEFQLDACEELEINIFDEDEGDFIGWRQFLEKQGIDLFGDECCQAGWLKLLKSFNGPGSRNMIFNVEADGSVLAGGYFMKYRVAAGVYLEGEAVAPEQLPSHYLFLVGDDND